MHRKQMINDRILGDVITLIDIQLSLKMHEKRNVFIPGNLVLVKIV